MTEGAVCPTCRGPAVAVETATAHLGNATTIDLTLRCERDDSWVLRELSVADAIRNTRDAIGQSARVGASHAAHGLLLELSQRADEAYVEYEVALGCADACDRAFCHERRASYEASRGWLRTALGSLRGALSADRAASGARETTYRQAIGALEREMTLRGIDFPPPDRATHDKRWLRECEIERPPGFGMRNEIGQPLAADVIEIERLIRAERWDDAVAALEGLLRKDPSLLVDAIGFASRGAELARKAGRRDVALATQRLVVTAYEIWASWSTSGGEGIARTAEVERERARLSEWQRR